MKSLIRILIIILCSQYLTNRLVEQIFVPGNWSYFLAHLAMFVPVCLITGAILVWAFERKVADLHFEGKKVGTMKEGDE